ncbi:MAG TPA: CHAD domain-containing protein [Planctomycetota bacterium]
MAANRVGVLRQLSSRLRGELSKVRKNPADIEAVHDARVAARRLLAGGELWAHGVRGWFSLRSRLPKVVRRLGRVRNLDVSIQFLAKGPPQDRAARRALADALKEARKRRRLKLLDWLTAARLKSLTRKLDDVLKAVRRRPLVATPGPSDLAPYFARIASLSAGGAWASDVEVAHEIRREVRRLRYGHETVSWAYGKADVERAVRVLRAVQEAAGAWQDRCVLTRLAAKAVRKGKVEVPLAPLLARVDRESKELSRRFALALNELLELRPAMLGEVP